VAGGEGDAHEKPGQSLGDGDAVGGTVAVAVAEGVAVVVGVGAGVNVGVGGGGGVGTGGVGSGGLHSLWCQRKVSIRQPSEAPLLSVARRNRRTTSS
jgi:hypothetical protein